MKRQLYTQLLEWKESNRRKPLLLQGARQVGKTWLISEFGKNEYDNFIYLNFEETPELRSFFDGNKNPYEIIENLGLYLGKKIEEKGTLICFDEIQVAPQALTSLKYFQEKSPEFHLIAAGSLLGVSLGKVSSFPVGKVNFLTLYPLSFSEYLVAIGEDLLLTKVSNHPLEVSFPEVLHQKLLAHLKRYLFLGGMPEVVSHYLENQDIKIAREIQLEIIQAYQQDFSKYTAADQAIKTSEVWESVPFQLAKENKKFKYSDVRKKARASTFEQTINWLKNAGLIHPVFLLRTPKLPLRGYGDFSKFKIYLLDTGLLGAMLELTSDTIVRPGKLFTEYNGAFIENFIALELIKNNFSNLFYWTSGRMAEVDFIIQSLNKIYPIEVKSGTNLNTKSLRSYAEKYQPSHLIRLSPRNFIKSDDFFNLPLYATSRLASLLNEGKNQ